MNPLLLQVSIYPFASAAWIAITIMLVPFIKRLLVTLGIGFVVYNGYALLFEQAKSYVIGSLSGAPANMVILLEMARVDDAAMMVLSAISIKIGFKLAEGATRTMYLKA